MVFLARFGVVLWIFFYFFLGGGGGVLKCFWWSFRYLGRVFLVFFAYCQGYLWRRHLAELLCGRCLGLPL